MPYGSTKLRIADEYCPRALQHAEQGTPAHREHFHVGTACHVMLEALQLARGDHDELSPDTVASTSDDVRTMLIAGGRQWRGEIDLPLRESHVAEGIGLALAWHARHGTIARAHPEIGIGMAIADDGTMTPTRYSDTPANGYRTSLDLLYYDHVGGDEDGDEGHTLVVARDYKTAWSAGDHLLDESQMRAQAVLALARADADGIDVSGVRIEIGAVRSGRIYARTLYRAEDARTLDDWRADLAATVRGLDGQRRGGRERVAVPSTRCGGCPYLHACPDGAAWLMGTQAEPAAMARQLVAVEALRAGLVARLRDALDGGDTIVVDGHEVGHVGATQRVVRPDAAASIAEHWGAGHEWSLDLAAGLIRAAKIGPSQADAIARALAPERGAKAIRETMLADWIETRTVGRFGVRSAGEEVEP